jgi:hypothetical protein
MSSQTKPSLVFCHGILADGSCFTKVMPTSRPHRAGGHVTEHATQR